MSKNNENKAPIYFSWSKSLELAILDARRRASKAKR